MSDNIDWDDEDDIEEFNNNNVPSITPSNSSNSQQPIPESLDEEVNETQKVINRGLRDQAQRQSKPDMSKWDKYRV